MKKMMNLWEKQPVLVILAGFLVIIIVGSGCLMLPQADRFYRPTSFIDSFFTATSAVTVTGLIVKDTAEWSCFGQLIILIIIQLGGLGIMTTYVFIGLLIGKVLSPLDINLIQGNYGVTPNKIKEVLKIIVAVTFIFEIFLAAWLILFADFSVFDGIFHSISAFCNAGFSTFSENLRPHQSNLAVIFPIMAAIVIGGLGFPVWRYILSWLLNDKKTIAEYRQYSKIILWANFYLIFGGFLILFTIGGFGGLKEILGALFQSVTARTAGFNTVVIANMNPASHLILMFLMFIGGASGGTAGGIKIMTFFVLALLLCCTLKGESRMIFKKRTFDNLLVKKAILLVGASLVIIFIFTFLLLVTEKMPFDVVLFEVVSAFGTVGLSLGLTFYLSEIGKFLVLVLMLIGRIGPLLLILYLIKRKFSHLTWPEEKNIFIG